MKNCRVICDLKSFLGKIYQKGSVMGGLEEVKTFLSPVRSTTENAATVDDSDLINHCGMFVTQLETLFIKS